MVAMVTQQWLVFIFLLKNFILMFIFERDTASGGEGQGEGDTQILQQAPGSELSAQNLTRRSNSQTVRS